MNRLPSPASRWAVVVVVALAIAAGSLSPAPAGGSVVLEDAPLVGGDKYLHFLGYFLLGTALVAAVDERHPTPRVVAAAVLAAAAFGTGIEFLQLAVPGRTPAAADALANAAGAATGGVLVGVVRRHPGTERR